MKRYRVMKPHEWQDRPGGGTINGKPGEMAVISDEVFEAAPPGTFDLLPGEDGYVAPVAAEAPAPVSDTPEPASAPVEAPEAMAEPFDPNSVPPNQRKPKAEALKPKPKKR